MKISKIYPSILQGRMKKVWQHNFTIVRMIVIQLATKTVVYGKMEICLSIFLFFTTDFSNFRAVVGDDTSHKIESRNIADGFPNFIIHKMG